jgi:hypothetical protein
MLQSRIPSWSSRLARVRSAADRMWTTQRFIMAAHRSCQWTFISPGVRHTPRRSWTACCGCWAGWSGKQNNKLVIIEFCQLVQRHRNYGCRRVAMFRATSCGQLALCELGFSWGVPLQTLGADDAVVISSALTGKLCRGTIKLQVNRHDRSHNRRHCRFRSDCGNHRHDCPRTKQDKISPRKEVVQDMALDLLPGTIRPVSSAWSFGNPRCAPTGVTRRWRKFHILPLLLHPLHTLVLSASRKTAGRGNRSILPTHR